MKIEERIHNSIDNQDHIVLSDLTFLIPVRIDSTERRENTDTVIRYLFSHFDTSVILLEADKEQKLHPDYNYNGILYKFIEDSDSVYRKVVWINKLLSMANTPFVAIWDVDAIAPVEQIIDSLSMLRSGEATMSLPFDGRFYSCDKVSCALFKKYLNINILLERIQVMPLMHGYHSPGGAFMVNKDKYIEIGGENENFNGWGSEDYEHIKRVEVNNLHVHYSTGPLFHLCHPIGSNSRFADQESEKQGSKEVLKTCSFIKI